MFSLTYRLVCLISFMVFYSFAYAQETSTSENSGVCEGSPELNVTSNNINLDQKTMTFFLEGDIFVTGEGFCFSTDSEVSIITNEQNPSKIDEFEIMGEFSLTLARENQTHIKANKGKFVEEENKFVFEDEVVITDFYQGANETLKADRGQYLLSTDNFSLEDNIILEIETITLTASKAEFISAENLVKFTNEVEMINNDPTQKSEIRSEVAEYYFDDRVMILSDNVSGTYGPSTFSGRYRLVYNWNSEDN